jgi:GxGYxYP putative glycoside hydrolase C-terminal domain
MQNPAEEQKCSEESLDWDRRTVLRKIALGSAIFGSVAIFGSSLLSQLTKTSVRNQFAPNYGSSGEGTELVQDQAGIFAGEQIATSVADPSATAPAGYSSLFNLPKPANAPALLYTASIHDGIPSLQLAVIAGILARNRPVIYMTDNSFVDRNIQTALSKHYGVSFNGLQSIGSLLAMFGSAACGSPARWIQYESSFDTGSTLGQNQAVDQLNAVRTLCSVYDALPVPAGQSPPVDAERSPMYDVSSWGTGVPLYQKVWSLVSGSVGKQWIAINPPSGSSPRLDMTDYITMSKAFSFQVPLVQFNSTYPSVQSQKDFAASVINAYPTPYRVLGYTGIGQPGGGSYEVNFVSALSGGSAAKQSALSNSNPSAHGAGYYTASQLVANMSAKSAFAPFSGASFPDPVSPPAYNSSQKYITIIASQGDCLDWTENNIASYMQQCQNVGMPIGLTMTQMAQWLSPPVLHWFIDNIQGTSGIVTSGSAGAGYNHVSQLPDVASFLSVAGKCSSHVNVKDFFFIDGPDANPIAHGSAIANEYISGLKNGGVTPRACYWWSPSGVAPSLISGVPCFFTALNISETDLSSQSQCNTAISNAIKKARSNFVVMFLNSIWPNPSFLKSACASREITPLPPGTFANLYRATRGLAPV